MRAVKNICLVNSTRFWGGGEKLILDHAVGFKSKGYRVCIAAHRDGELQKRAEQANIDTIDVEHGSLSFLNISKVFSLRSYFLREQIDTVFFTTSHDAKVVATAATWAGVKNIVYLRGLAVPIRNSHYNQWMFGKACTHIIANSEATKNTILSKLKIDAQKVQVIYHGIEIPQTTPKKLDAVLQKANGFIIGNAGRLTLQKGQHLLIDVALQLKKKQIPFTIFIAGQGELKPQLEALINQHQLTKEVVLLDFVADIHAFMESIDVFVLTSNWEGFGFVITEAMVHSKPVVAFDISSNPEIVINKLTGFLVPPNNTNTMADALYELYRDDDLRTSFGTNARNRVISNFELHTQIEKVEQLLINQTWQR